MEITTIIDNNKTLKGIRLLNFLIDLGSFYLFSIFILFVLVLIFLWLGIDLSFVDELEKIHPLLDRLLTYLCYFMFMFALEYLTKGRSIGKYVTGTMVVMENGTKPSVSNFLIRNLSRVIPFEALSFLGKKGFHDSCSKTVVVNKKKYLEDLEIVKGLVELGEVV